jgi:hypothetical protein
MNWQNLSNSTSKFFWWSVIYKKNFCKTSSFVVWHLWRDSFEWFFFGNKWPRHQSRDCSLNRCFNNPDLSNRAKIKLTHTAEWSSSAFTPKLNRSNFPLDTEFTGTGLRFSPNFQHWSCDMYLRSMIWMWFLNWFVDVLTWLKCCCVDVLVCWSVMCWWLCWCVESWGGWSAVVLMCWCVVCWCWCGWSVIVLMC